MPAIFGVDGPCEGEGWFRVEWPEYPRYESIEPARGGPPGTCVYTLVPP